MRKYIYTLRSDILEDAINNYREYVSNPTHPWRQSMTPTAKGINYNNGEGIKPMPLSEHVYNLPKPRYDIARAQIIALIDIMYRSSLYAREDNGGMFYVPSQVLKTVSSNYRYILDTLSHLLILNIQYTYKEGRNSRTLYSIKDDTIFHLQLASTLNRTVTQAIQKIDDYLDDIHQKRKEEIIKATSQTFVDRYNNNLAKLKIDTAAATNHINKKYSNIEDELKRKARLNTVNKLANKDFKKELNSIDDNGRLYHIGTELQKDIKKYTNIAYTIDCKNSHPFLFTYMILYYIVKDGIDIRDTYDDENYHTFLYYVIRFFINNKGIYHHYMFSDFLCKNLENRRLRKQDRAKIMQYVARLGDVAEDVWRYIYDVAEGKLWDMFEDTFNEDRTIVKQKVFASVMYSYYSPRKRKKKEENTKWIDMFKGLYPTVFALINDIKKSLYEQCRELGMIGKLEKPRVVYIGEYRLEYEEKDKVMLALLLMKLESKIFTQILTKLFNKRIVCIGIHDAVAVIKSRLSEDEIKSMMMDVYAQYGLIPTLSVDYY